MFSDLLRDDVFRLETSRLWLRWPRMTDAPSMLRHAGEKEIAEKTAGIPHPYLPEHAEKFIFASRAGNAAGNQIVLALSRKARHSEIIGVIGIHETRPGHALIGYWLASPFHSLGFMGEAAAALISLAYGASDLQSIVADALVENMASRKVLENCGFESTGIAIGEHRGQRVPLAKYRFDRAAWDARTKAITRASTSIGSVA